MVEKTNTQSDKELEDYRKQAFDLWFKDGSCTGGNAEQAQDTQDEDELKQNTPSKN